MAMGLTAVGGHEALKNVTQTSSVVISSIRAMKVDSIIVVLVGFTIEVLLDLRR